MERADSMLHHTYSDGIEKKKIAILGPVPPPLGGISVHIARITKKFLRQNNCVKNFDSTRRKFFVIYLYKFWFFLVSFRPHLVYYHTPYTWYAAGDWLLLLLGKVLMRYKVVVVEHDCRYLYDKSVFYKKIFRFFMRHVDQHILIGSLTYASYRDNAILMQGKYTIEGAFLPPDYSEENKIIATYPDDLHVFIHNHSPVIVANAHQLVLLEGGNDLYGIDSCIAMLKVIKKDYPGVGLIVVLAQIGNQAYYEYIQNTIIHAGLADSIYFLCGNKQLWPLLKLANVFVRPTLSDGASVSVQEALCFDTSVVASDVCIRPEGTTLFKTGDQEDFICVVRKHLKRIGHRERNERHDNLFKNFYP